MLCLNMHVVDMLNINIHVAYELCVDMHVVDMLYVNTNNYNNYNNGYF